MIWEAKIQQCNVEKCNWHEGAFFLLTLNQFFNKLFLYSDKECDNNNLLYLVIFIFIQIS